MEDDAAQARIVSKFLERSGFVVDWMADGTAGLARYNADLHDAVVVDQTMPGRSGLDVIRELFQRGPVSPVVMVTGTGDERTAVEAMKLGASDYVIKDAKGAFMDALPLVVGRAIAQRQTLRENEQMERELAQNRKLKAIGQLAAGIAHEINSPMQCIGHNGKFLQRACHSLLESLNAAERLLQAVRQNAVTDELLAEVESKLRAEEVQYWVSEIPQAIDQSLESVDHVAGIVRAMQEFSHPDMAKKQPADINHLIESAITLSRNEWKYVADIVTDFASDLPRVSCLSSEIHRVILNLIVNAAQAIAEGPRRPGDGKGHITVHTLRCDSDVEIRIEDDGPGIPPEIRDRVFELFFTTKKVGQGTGQGLAIAYAIVVEKHGGTIHFETEMGQGTTFIVRLPIAETPAPCVTPVAEQQMEPATV
jgi:signal transduction histidine kinase